MRPMRISSEGPEVVPGTQHQTPDKYLVVPFAQRLSKVFHHKPPEEPQPQLQLQPQPHPQPRPERQLYSPPPKRYDSLPYRTEHDSRRNRSIGLIPALLLIFVAFLIGGGIAGGVGGAMVVQKQSKISSLETNLASATSSSTPTATASTCVPTVILDVAGCPSIHNTTYISSTSEKFLQLCGIELTPSPSTTKSDSIDISSSQQSTWDACLEACASYNENVQQGGCMGASWIIFSPTEPQKNSVCYLKSAVGSQTPAGNVTVGLQVVSGQLINP